MSQEDLKQFLAAVRQDPSLQEQLRQPDADPVALAAAAGYRISAEEYQEGLEALSEEEIETIVGGAHHPAHRHHHSYGHTYGTKALGCLKRC